MAGRALALLLPLLLAFTWAPGQHVADNPVEQQTPGGATQPDQTLWVVNPRINECAWDPDDTMAATGFGNLAAGETTERHECVFGDWVSHLWNVQVFAQGRGSDRLVVMIGWSNPDGARSFVIPGVAGPKNSTTYNSCFVAPHYDNGSPLLPLVPGSNGGHAQLTDFFIRITNAGTRTLRDVMVRTSVEPDYHPCSDGRTILDLQREDIIPNQLWWYH